MSIVNCLCIPAGREDRRTSHVMRCCEGALARAEALSPRIQIEGESRLADKWGCKSCLRCLSKTGIGRKLRHCKHQNDAVNRILGEFCNLWFYFGDQQSSVGGLRLTDYASRICAAQGISAINLRKFPIPFNPGESLLLPILWP